MSDPVLYHGTRAAFFGHGGLVLPPTASGATPNHPASTIGDRDEWVYVTPDPLLAAAYAIMAKGKGRPRVLVVIPLGPVEVDDSTVDGEEQESFRTEAATVVRVLSIADAEARANTEILS